MIHPKTQPDASRRSRLFETACFKLTEWWYTTFRIVPNRGVRNQTFQEVENQRHISEKKRKPDAKGKGKATSVDGTDESNPYSDRLRSVKSLMKHALLREGSADTSSLLFTALCRALDVPTRLIVSLQAIPWTNKYEKSKKQGTEPVTILPLADSDSDLASQTDTMPDGLKGKALKQQSRPKDRKRPLVRPRSSSVEPPLEGWPPVVWTEVFSRAEGRWIPIDPIRYLIDKKKMFEPSVNCRINRMMYVVAYEEGEGKAASSSKHSTDDQQTVMLETLL